MVDVRSQPHSRFHSDYDREALTRTLKGGRASYRNYDQEFGAGQAGPRYAGPGGYLDFERFVQSPRFWVGLEKLEKSMAHRSLRPDGAEGKYFEFVAKIFPL